MVGRLVQCLGSITDLVFGWRGDVKPEIKLTWPWSAVKVLDKDIQIRRAYGDSTSDISSFGRAKRTLTCWELREEKTDQVDLRKTQCQTHCISFPHHDLWHREIIGFWEIIRLHHEYNVSELEKCSVLTSPNIISLLKILFRHHLSFHMFMFNTFFISHLYHIPTHNIGKDWKVRQDDSLFFACTFYQRAHHTSRPLHLTFIDPCNCATCWLHQRVHLSTTNWTWSNLSSKSVLTVGNQSIQLLNKQ